MRLFSALILCVYVHLLRAPLRKISTRREHKSTIQRPRSVPQHRPLVIHTHARRGLKKARQCGYMISLFQALSFLLMYIELFSLK